MIAEIVSCEELVSQVYCGGCRTNLDVTGLYWTFSIVGDSTSTLMEAWFVKGRAKSLKLIAFDTTFSIEHSSMSEFEKWDLRNGCCRPAKNTRG